MVVVDDEEEDDDEEMEMVATSHQQPSEPDGGGWVVEGEEQQGQGGFLPIPEADPQAFDGGFIPDDEQFNFVEAPGGGFLLVDDNNNPLVDSTTTGGGFLPEFEGGGGFLPEPGADYATEGGFLPELPIPSLDFNSNAGTGGGAPTRSSPSPPPPQSRIPVRAIPRALTSLNLPSSADILAMFHDVASDDEDGIASVRRERFVEACGVLLSVAAEGESSDDDSEEEGEAYEGEEGDGTSSRRRRAPLRRSTRGRPVTEDEGTTDGTLMDVDDLPSEESEASDSSLEIVGESKGKKATKGKGKGKTTKTTKIKKPRALSKEELQEAEDTFELFFEGSLQKGTTLEKKIGLADLERVTRLLNEKMSEDGVRSLLFFLF